MPFRPDLEVGEVALGEDFSLLLLAAPAPVVGDVVVLEGEVGLGVALPPSGGPDPDPLLVMILSGPNDWRKGDTGIGFGFE